jgi:hypothetical protein
VPEQTNWPLSLDPRGGPTLAILKNSANDLEATVIAKTRKHERCIASHMSVVIFQERLQQRKNRRILTCRRSGAFSVQGSLRRDLSTIKINRR